MYSVAVGIRPYGQLVEHYEENMLSQMHSLSLSLPPPPSLSCLSHLHHREKGARK